MAQNQVKVIIVGENQADRVFKEVNAGLGSIGKSTSDLARLAGGLTAAFAVGELARFAKGLIDVQDQAGKTAQKLGVTAQFYTGLAYAAKLSDVENEALSKGLVFLNKSIDAAQVKGSEAAGTFQRLGISVREAGGQAKPTEQVLLDIADKFSHMQDAAAKTALAVKLFGRAGAELIPLLNQGRDGIDAMRMEAERLGLVIDDKTAAAAERLNDSVKRMEAMAQGATNQFLSGFVPAINDVAEAFSKAGTAADGFRGAGERTGGLVTQAIDWFTQLGFAIRVTAKEQELAGEKMRLAQEQQAGLNGAARETQGRIAQLSQGLHGLISDYEGLATAEEKAHQAAKTFGAGLIGPPVPPGFGRTPANPPVGTGAPAVVPGLDLAALREARALIPDVDLVFNKITQDAAEAVRMLNLASGPTGGAEKFLSILGTKLPTGWPDELKNLETQIDVIFANLATKTEEVQGLVEQRAISEVEGGQRIVDLHHQTGVELEALLPRYRELAALTGDPRLGAGVEALAVRVKNLQKETDVLGQHIRDTFVDGFANAVGDIVSGTQSIGDAFRQMARSILSDIARIITKMLIMRLITSLFGGLFGGGGGGGTIALGGLSGPNVMAQGGPFSAGEPFIAGEMGLPELIVPQSAGTVVPHSKLAGMMQGGGDNFYIDARGADIGVEQRIRALQKALPQTVGASVRAMYEYQRRR